MGSLLDRIKQAKNTNASKKRTRDISGTDCKPVSRLDSENAGRELSCRKNKAVRNCSTPAEQDSCSSRPPPNLPSPQIAGADEGRGGAAEGPLQEGAVAAVDGAALERRTLRGFYSWRQRAHVEPHMLRLHQNVRSRLEAGVLAPPFQYFALQEPACHFADSHELFPELRVFSYEKANASGRGFLVTSFGEFWKRYREMPSAGRHFYEILREGWPCHLYFDLEFKPEFNPGVDGQALVDTVIQLAATVFQKRFGLQLEAGWVVELDSSTPAKFSRHLIVRVPEACFACTAHVGCFVEDICSLIYAPDATQDLQALIVAKDEEGGRTCFIDRGVYTRNRAFRLMFSSKAGKSSTLKPTGRLRSHLSATRSFYESLVGNVPLEPRLLTCFDGAAPPRTLAHRVTAMAAGWNLPQAGTCPLPSVEAHILAAWNQGGARGEVRNWLWSEEQRLLIINVKGSRFCANVGREHKSNGIYFVIDLQAGVWFQKCYDPDCKGFSSESMPLPPELLRDSSCAFPASKLDAGPLEGIDDQQQIESMLDQLCEVEARRLEACPATASNAS